MPVRPFHFFATGAVLAAVGCLLPAMSTKAADVSEWDRQQHSAVRLISGQPERGREGTIWRAGVEIRLEEGWKTYWRYPGDSGIPPRFNFSGSTNVRDIRVLWPAPMRFSDGAGISIGYADRVILPLRIRPRDPGSPVTVRLKLDYAVCEKLCVPVDASVALALSETKSPHEDLLRASEARVPRKALIGDDGPLAITAVRRQSGEKSRILVDVRTPEIADLFAEGPNERWSLPLPQAISGPEGGIMRFAFALDGMPPDAKTAGAQVTLTAVSSSDAVEVAFYLD
ncbi:MAG TPA: protein-disulfide reductase DsbD domain-containing protein [Xanthobacteraceae bacterium]|nr:protein-disulfide reductase DsbD domain-containing protein [Xanthobacteraceae bacterium]